MCLGDLFGTACADGFTDKFADMICQERGFEGRVDKSFLIQLKLFHKITIVVYYSGTCNMFCFPISVCLFVLLSLCLFLHHLPLCHCICLSVSSLFLHSLYTGGYMSTDYNARYITRNRAYTNFTCPEDDNTLLNCTYDIVDSCDGNEAIIVCLYG